MALDLQGMVIVVTGAGRGIAREVALLAAGLGARVVVDDPGVAADGSGFDAGPAEQVAGEIRERGGEAIACTEAVGTMEAGERIIGTALEAYGRLDGLVNVAGILRDRMVFNMTEEEWDAVIRIHLKGTFTTVRPASVLFRQQRYGRIVNFSSDAGVLGNLGQANYGAAKAAIIALTRCLARDLGRYGVTANAISPSASTRLTATVPDAATELRKRAGITDNLLEMPQNSDPAYVAPMVCYLLSDHAWDINGRVFKIVGGDVGIFPDLYPPKDTIYKDVRRHGAWTVAELTEMVPVLLRDYVNPARPPDTLDLPGRPVEATPSERGATGAASV